MAVRGNLKSEWEISPEEFSSYFIRYFHLNSPGQHLSGEKARQFFLQTNIPLEDLSLIWELADIDSDGALDAAEFSVAMHLVQRYLQGFSLPSSLPPPLLHCYHVALRPHLPIATKEHVLKCRKVFEAFHKDLSRGVLRGEAMTALMARSNLTKDQIRHIWTLADQDEDGQFTFYEFTTAMHLIFVTKLGYILPMNLDPYSVLPPSVMSVIQDGSEVGPATPTVPLATPTVPLAPPPKRHAHQTPDQADMCHAHSKSSAKGYGANPFQTPDLFDELSELEAYEEEQDAEPEDQPQQYQLRTGGGGGRGLGSHDYPDSPLSMIPEEDLEGMDSYNSSQRSHDRSLDPSPVPELKQGSGLGIRIITPPPRSPKGEGQKGVEHHVSSSEQVPWYQEASNQEVWQTTPAYRPDGEGEWSGKTTPTYHPEGEGAGQGTEENQRRLSSVQKLLVTEAVVPVLQVAQPVEVERTRSPMLYSPSAGEKENESDEEEEEGLTSEDIAELEKITKASQKFLTDFGTTPSSEADSADLSGYKRELGAASLDGLETTILNMRAGLSSPSITPPITDQSEAAMHSDQSASLMAVQSAKPNTIKRVSFEEIESGVNEKLMHRFEDLETEVKMSVTNAKKNPSTAPEAGWRSHDQAPGHTPTSPTPRVAEGPAPTNGRLQWSRDCTQRTAEDARLVATSSPSLSSSRKLKLTGEEPPAAQQQKSLVKSEVKSDKRSQKAKERQRVASEMDDLDSLFEGELASINQVFQEFEVKDKKTEKRILTEKEELKGVKAQKEELPAPPEDLLAQVSKRRSLLSEDIEKQWEQEMQAYEQEGLREMQQQKASDDTVFLQNLDNELKSLIQTKEEDMKQSHQEWLLKEKRLKEEKERIEKHALEVLERREKERKERLERLANSEEEPDQQELTVEEWIQYLEEKKKQGMTPAQLEEYERRKKARIEKDKERAERLRQEEEEKRKKTREKIDREMRSYRQRQMEIEESRITEDQLRQNQEELARRQEEESRLRKARGEKMRKDDKDREIADLKPKARSALAARWEESVKSRGNGKGRSSSVHSATVLSGTSDQKALEKEEERLIRRISANFSNGVKISPEQLKRHSAGDLI